MIVFRVQNYNAARFSYNFITMRLAILLALVALSATMHCPLSPNVQSTCFSGILTANPDSEGVAQDMSYTQTYDNPVGQIPQVCLSICGYEDHNTGAIQMQVDHSQITQQSFLVRLRTPADNRWTKVDLSYLVSTKPEIEIGLVSAVNPNYNANGYIALPYKPTLRLTDTIKIKPFIVSINLAAKKGGLLAINYQKLELSSGIINFYYSSKSCNIYALSLSVVIFDPITPGLLFLDGTLQQNSLSTTTETKVDRTYVEELRIYFVGFMSVNAKDVSGLSVSINFSKSFSIMIDSTHISSIKVNYMVISFVQCGSCTGYPCPYNGSCYKECPLGTTFSAGICVPINCGNGFQLDSNNKCVPVCGPNQYFSGQVCSCKPQYNLINGVCSQCPPGTFYNYIYARCEPTCGNNAEYNTIDGRCYCKNGYVIINGQCSVCPPGTQYDYNSQQCQQLPQCGINEQYTQYGCACREGYYKIRGQCGVCPPDMIYNVGLQTCTCKPGAQWDSNTQRCVYQPSCGPNEQLVYNRCVCAANFYKINGVCRQCPPNSYYNSGLAICQCSNGYRLVGSNCVPDLPTCRECQYLVGNTCQCRPGCTRDNRGICTIIINCPDNEIFSNGACVCKPGCSRMNDGRCYNTQCPPGYIFSNQYLTCIQICAPGSIWSQTAQQCISQCQPNFIWNGNQCVPNCRPNQRWDGRQCIPNCQTGTFYDSNSRRCVQNCRNDQEWNGYKCVCRNNYIEESSYNRCRPACSSGQRWDNYNNRCIPNCSNNEQWNGNSCECIPGLYRIRGVCDYCPPNQTYNPNLQRCVPNIYCPPPHNIINDVCICAVGWQRDPNTGKCLQQCGQGYYRDNNNNCVPYPNRCNPDQIQVGNTCECRVGLYNVNGRCSICPEYSVQNNGVCVCVANNYVLRPGFGTCPVPDNNPIDCGSNGYWDSGNSCCKCHNPYIWITGGCKQRQKCPQYAEWTGYGCTCIYGYILTNGICQAVNQTPYCPPNSQFNGLNCQCNPGFFPINSNGQCERCPPNTYWTGKFCGTINSCQDGWIWDKNKNCCSYQNHGCKDNEEWDGASCRCKQGFFFINNACVQCPYGTVFDGKQCSKGIPTKCADPYSYFNGNSCVCLPGYWQLAGGCVSCPPTYQWSGVCCSSQRGLTRAIGDSDNKTSNTVPVLFK